MTDDIKQKYSDKAKVYFEMGEIVEALMQNNLIKELKDRLMLVYNLQIEINKMEKKTKLTVAEDAVLPDIIA